MSLFTLTVILLVVVWELLVLVSTEKELLQSTRGLTLQQPPSNSHQSRVSRSNNRLDQCEEWGI